MNPFRKGKKSDLELLDEKIDQRLHDIEKQVEGMASRVSSLTSSVDQKEVDIRKSATKEFKHQLDEVRTSLEQLSLELNNQILDVSNRVENLDQNSSNWSFAINEQVEEFRSKYVDVLEELRQAKNIAVEREKIITEKYEELVKQLKEKEKLALERESLSTERISSLQGEVEKREQELGKNQTKLTELEADLKETRTLIDELQKAKFDAKELEINHKKALEEIEDQKYEIERLRSQINTMVEDNKQSIATTKAVKTFLADSESGRILSLLLNSERITIDELSSLTGIATFTVHQIIQRFSGLGIVTYDEGARKARLHD
ncbi:MAG: hypothetical protein EAX86_03675 [Candidatus Heimdallarchaeota archaeon]|nr:hypothetical protein [Candidatus Heimdallarchaeota archaeon]